MNQESHHIWTILRVFLSAHLAQFARMSTSLGARARARGSNFTVLAPPGIKQRRSTVRASHRPRVRLRASRAHGSELLLASASGLLLHADKMSFFTFFGRRHWILRVLLVQVLASLGTFAAPSPIIKFPGDDFVARTDKEVALVSALYLSQVLQVKT